MDFLEARWGLWAWTSAMITAGVRELFASSEWMDTRSRWQVQVQMRLDSLPIQTQPKLQKFSGGRFSDSTPSLLSISDKRPGGAASRQAIPGSTALEREQLQGMRGVRDPEPWSLGTSTTDEPKLRSAFDSGLTNSHSSFFQSPADFYLRSNFLKACLRISTSPVIFFSLS